MVPITENVVITGCEDGNIRAVHLFPHRLVTALALASTLELSRPHGRPALQRLEAMLDMVHFPPAVSQRIDQSGIFLDVL